MVNSLLSQFRRLRRHPGSGMGAGDWARLLGDGGHYHRLSEHEGAAVLTATARIEGRPLVLVLSDFEAHAGTLGRVEGELVAAAFDHATQHRLPVLAVCASGGVRQQEGAIGFMQMVKAVEAVSAHRDARLLYVAYLSQPTTGGVFASYASLSQVTWAAPGALIGFTGPKVVEALTGHQELRGVQIAENLLRHGLLDDIFPADELRRRMALLLRALTPDARVAAAPAPATSDGDAAVAAWESVLLTRRPDRPSTRELLRLALEDVSFLRGDRAGGKDDPSCIAAIGRFQGIPIVVIGSDRGIGVEVERIAASGLRKARRAMRLAGQLGVPLVSLIDTPGAETTAEAEEAGLSLGIANCIASMLEVPSPTVSVLLGEGTGGGALALLPADRVIAARHAWLSPIAPEGAAAILYGSPARAPEMAEAQGIVAPRLAAAGIVDTVVSEGGPQELPARMAAAVAAALRELIGENPEQRLARRRARYRRLGGPG